jgi:membrane-associated protein
MDVVERVLAWLGGVVETVMGQLLAAPPWLAYTIVGLLALAEAAVFLGFVLPGETAVVIGGVLASQGRLSLPVLLVLVPVCAIVGDSIGYEVGAKLGPKVLTWPLLNRHLGRLERAQEFLRERGGPAVFLGRWTAFLRAVMPGLAGLSRMPYRVFLLWNAIGGVVWGVTFTLVGYLAGTSYRTVERVIGTGGAVTSAVVIVGGLVVWHLRRKRAERTAEAGHAVLAETTVGSTMVEAQPPDDEARPTANPSTTR